MVSRPAVSGARHTLGGLSDVALVPGSRQAWAVGYWERSPGDERPLAYHWTGRAWLFTRVPNAGLGVYLQDVVATSARNVWAVGAYYASKHDHRPYVAHWNGGSWKRVSAPALHGGLRGVTAVRGAAWAAGYAVTSVGGQRVDKTLIVRWNGRAWKPVASPGLGYSLGDIDAVSARNAWAVGNNDNRTIALHWNGRTWQRARIPNAPNPTLEGVAALRTRVYAVGQRAAKFYSPTRTLMLQWSAGGGWRRVPVPSPGFAAQLHGVAATSPGNVWTVGEYQAPSGDQRPLVLHWNGRVWQRMSVPGPDGHVTVQGVATDSPRRAFAVGYNYFDYNPAHYAYIAGWNGTAWRWWLS